MPVNDDMILGNFYEKKTRTKATAPFTWGKLVSLIMTPGVTAKDDTPVFVPTFTQEKKMAVIRKYDSETGAAMSCCWVDVDSGSPPLDQLAGLAEDSGLAAAIHSSASAHRYKDVGGTPMLQGDRWRIILPIKRPMHCDEWLILQEVLARYFGGGSEACRIQQPIYLPTNPNGGFFKYRIVNGDPLDPGTPPPAIAMLIEKIMMNARDEEHKKMQQARSAPLVNRGNVSGDSIIERVNQAYSLGNVLVSYGYEKTAYDRYLHPKSRSGKAGVVILCGEGTGQEYYYSHHSRETDSLADGKKHDVFDVLLHWQFSGDTAEAVRSLAKDLIDPSEQARLHQEWKAKHAGNAFKGMGGDIGENKAAQALSDRLITFDDEDSQDLPGSIIDRIVPVGEVTLLAGHGGAGKSYVALLIAILVVLGRNFAGLKTKACRVLFFSAEDGKAVLQHRVRKICNALGVTMAELNDHLHILDASNIDPTLFIEKPTALLEELKELVHRLDIGMTMIDNSSDTYGGDEIRRVQVRAFMRAIRTSLALPDRAVVLLAHVNKEAVKYNRFKTGNEDYSGSTAWHNSCRSRLSLSNNQKGALSLEHLKANNGPKADLIELTWIDGVPLEAERMGGVFDEVEFKHTREKIAEQDRARDEAAKTTIMEIIEDFNRRGERVTTSMQGSYTAYKLLKDCKGFPTWMKKDHFDKLLRELDREGLLIRKVVRTLNRKSREVFVTAPNWGHDGTSASESLQRAL
ncbi:MAG: AAA family ATPase [Syntrophales bacterium]